jgi:predicted HNH restriction endonuclease
MGTIASGRRRRLRFAPLSNRPVAQHGGRTISNLRNCYWEDTLRFRIPVGTITNPGEAPPKEVLIEGGKMQFTVDAYERNWKARQACIVFHGTACAICGFDFSKVYGEIAKDFIHVHHFKAISAQDGPYEVDPQKDLVPVCPNCHSVLHMKTPCYELNEVKSLLGSANRDCW